MTPELRRQLYKWEYNLDKHGTSSDCIPLQLQILFSKLQLSSSWHEDTSALTQSFGWDLRENFQQHDVQEFCRVLFDAIERSVAGTPQHNLINELYQGKLTDYVKCVNCSNESRREDLFLDLSLTVKNEIDNVYNDSLEKALHNYLKAEVLTGDNKYACSHCQGKQDAVKGLKLGSLPYILTLQLKRFDLDYTTMQRVKLNDRVSFPMILNMNAYVGDGIAGGSLEDVEATQTEAEESAPVIRRLVPDDVESYELKRSKAYGYQAMDCDHDKEPLRPDFLTSKTHQDINAEHRRRERDRLVQTYFHEGPNVYELFSVLIHSGSASSGHYYAYIKSFERDKWYEFNDNTVKEIKDTAIKEVFGGAEHSLLGGSCGANAYLLCYRRIDPSNVKSVSSDEVPAYVQQSFEVARQKEEQESLERAERYSRIQVKVTYNSKEISLEVRPELTIGELKAKAMAVLGVKSAADDVRVRAYNSYTDGFHELYSDTDSLDDSNIYSNKQLALETRDSGTEWLVYDPSSISLKVYVWSESIAAQPSLGLDSKLGPPVRIQINKFASVKELTRLFAERFGISAEEQKVLKKSYMGASNYFEVVNTSANFSSSLLYARIYEGSVLYLEQSTEADIASKWVEEFNKESRRYKVKFNDPDQEQDPLDLTGKEEFTHQVSLDYGETLAVLKAAIVKELGLAEDKFVMKRGGMYGVELTDLTLQLIQAHLMNGCTVYIEKGTPMGPDDCRLTVHLAEIPRQPTTDGICYSFYQLLEMPMNSNLEISAVKQAICEAGNSAYPSLNLRPALIRLRERSNERLCEVMRDSDFLRDFDAYDYKQIALQVLSEPEQTKLGELIVLVRRWFPSSWSLSIPHELSVIKYSSVHDFFTRLSHLYEIPVTPMQFEELEVCRIANTWNFIRGDLLSEDWRNCPSSIANLTQEPWNLMLDGSLFL
jgi:hypothetical protein